MARIGGTRRKTSSVFTKPAKRKGKISAKRYLTEFSEGDRVSLGVEPAVHEGLYDPRFIGMTGIVSSRKGSCYEVKVRDMGKEKRVIVHPVHLKKV